MKKLLTTAIILTMMSCASAFADATYDASLEYNQGLDYYRVGNYDAAVDSFRKAISLDPNYIDAYYNLGVILQKFDKNADALTVFKQIIVRQPDDYDAVYHAAELSFALGQQDNAKRYLALIPQNSSVIARARVLAEKMNTDLETISKELKQQAVVNTMGKIPQSNGNYTNLPSPTGITTDRDGNLYVASFSSNAIIKITPAGAKSIFLKSESLNGPIDMEIDNAGNLYVANYNTNNVVKITPAGTASQLLGNIEKPYCLHIRDGVLFISSQGSNTVVRYKL